MILIRLRREDSRTIVSVAGRLDEKHLGELQEQCSAVGEELDIDLAEPKSADKAAIHWLCERRAQGDRILGPSPYIKLLLEREEPCSDSPTTSGGRGNGGEGE